MKARLTAVPPALLVLTLTLGTVSYLVYLVADQSGSRAVELANARARCAQLATKSAASNAANNATLAFAPGHGPNMVLQHDRPCVAGFTAHNAVTVELREKGGAVVPRRTARVRPCENFRVCLPPQPASGRPLALSLLAGGENRTAAPVRLGLVVVCAGQSNMDWTVASNQPALNFAGDPAVSLLRITTTNGPPSQATWQPGTLPHPVRHFSAACWQMGQELLARSRRPGAQPLPALGLVEYAADAAPISRFLPPSSVERCAHLPVECHEESPQCDRARKASLRDVGRLSEGLQLAGTLSAKAFVWYQGESDVTLKARYQCLQEQLLALVREMFGPQVAFVFTLLAPVPLVQSTQHLRQDQLSLLRCGPPLGAATGGGCAGPGPVFFASAFDLGTIREDGNILAIHPPDKRELGRRLALVVAALALGEAVPYAGPALVRATAVPQNGTVRLDFTAGGERPRLATKPTQECKTCCSSPPFDLAFGANASRVTWHRVRTMEVGEGGQVLLTVPPKARSPPRFVRYAFANYPQCALYDQRLRLPAPPFVRPVTAPTTPGLTLAQAVRATRWF